MSRYWPHPGYAEEQPLAHTILTTHVMTRAFQLGSAIGLVLGGTTYTLRRFSLLRAPPTPRSLPVTLLRGMGFSSVATMGFLAVGLPIMMRGKEEIEWKDRAWRLCENEPQMRMDGSTYVGMGAGAVAAAAMGMGERGRALVAATGWRGRVGVVGIGALIGTVDGMARKGVSGGTKGEVREEEKI
ncbi:hypothetical protein F5884DRAFT_467325 [Xylogone sp. PMI_703]|nr:hypothetical protein F5884DRAFT_467325 [Xylogone sp. PMI_703]